MTRKHTTESFQDEVLGNQAKAYIAIGKEGSVCNMSEGAQEELHDAITTLSEDIHCFNVRAGWWDNPREDGTLLMLMVSEIAEAMEGVRKDLMDDHLTHHKMVDVELADAVIRILDYCGYHKIDIGGIIAEKRAYNLTRADHQRENRNTDHGKKF